MPKDRDVYSLSGFVGLDKENKGIKVERNRGTDGKNFIIDSGTLKTRQGVKYEISPLLELGYDSEIIDFYEYGDTFVYITPNGFVFRKEDSIVKEIKGKEFEGLKPLFREEKDCLFVFCLNDVYVISIIEEEIIVYSLVQGPGQNPFEEESDSYKMFEKLPTPYEPTLYIGDNAFEDVNVLSNVSKYKLFLNSTTKDKEDNKYNLVTHFDEEKHGDYEYEVFFEGENVKEIKAHPLFFGKEGEDFKSIKEENIFNIDNPRKISTIYKPKENFEYLVEEIEENDENKEIITSINERLNLDDKTFFEFIMENGEQNVYQDMKILIETLEFNDNNWFVKYSLQVDVQCVYKDKNGNIKKSVLEEQIHEIFVEARAFEEFNIDFSNSEYYFSNDITDDKDKEFIKNNIPNEEDYTIINFSEEPIYFEKDKEEDFKTYATNWLTTNEQQFQSGIYKEENKVILQGNFYYNKKFSQESKFDFEQFYSLIDFIPTSDNPIIKEDIGVEIPEGATYLDDKENWHYYDQYSLETPLEQARWNLEQRIVNYYLGKTEGKGYIRSNLYLKTVMETSAMHYYVYEYDYKLGITGDYEVRTSFSQVIEIQKDSIKPSKDNLSTFFFDSASNTFNFSIRNYFYSKNIEPPLEVKVTFKENPDVEQIYNTRFGITFGSENRLFLAGNEEYPNIDRFNVSNDLLGNNVVNQSYELSYFPSKNYRVLGGKGAINGYVVATDTSLYVTKDHYPNDNKFFLRERNVTDEGSVVYREFKTNITKTPLNPNCIVSFYNDILVLSDEGLYGIEISSNVLTNERLTKLRSGFINKDLVDTIKSYGKEKVFIFEDNFYMYIVVEKTIYVSDIRYTSSNPNSEIGNTNYEMVKWELPFEVYDVKKMYGQIILMDKTRKHIYSLSDKQDDDNISLENEFIKLNDFGYFETKQPIETDNVSFTFYHDNIYFLVGIKNQDYKIENNLVHILNQDTFREVVNGSKLHLKEEIGYFEFEVKDLDEYERKTFSFEGIEEYNGEDIAIVRNYHGEELHLLHNNEAGLVLSPYKYSTRDYNIFYIDNPEEFKDVKINNSSNIVTTWISSILDFGNRYFEKTMFNIQMYATKKNKSNLIKIGYKTLRDSDFLVNSFQVSNSNNYNEVDYNSYSLTTFSEVGGSMPMKINNFLYIQFMIVGEGSIELNAVDILFKNNRKIKTIG